MLSRRDLLGMLNFDGLNVSLVPEVERGEVLVDSRGGGSFQKALHTHCGCACNADYNGVMNILKRAMGYMLMAGASLTTLRTG